MQLCARLSFPTGELPQRLDAVYQKLTFLTALNLLTPCGQQPQLFLVKGTVGLERSALQSLLKPV